MAIAYNSQNTLVLNPKNIGKRKQLAKNKKKDKK